MTENKSVIITSEKSLPNGKEPLFWLGTKVKCLVGVEEGRIGRVVGFYETLGLEDPPRSDFMYHVEFESDANGWCRWSRILAWHEIKVCNER